MPITHPSPAFPRAGLADSPLLTTAGAHRSRPPTGALVIATVAVSTFAFFAGPALLLGIGGVILAMGVDASVGPRVPAPLLGALGLVIGFAPMFLWVHLWLVATERRSLRTVGFGASGWAGRYVRGFGVGLALLAVPVGALALAGAVTGSAPDQAGPVGFAAGPAVLILAVGWLVQGAGEEVVFRGLFLQSIAARFGPLAGIVVSSGLFALAHGLNANLTALGFANLALFGILACLYALREGSLWGVCAIHSAWNWSQGQIYGLAVSGNSQGVGSLLGLRAGGLDVLTGGQFGPEGGLAVSIALLVGCVFLLRLPGSRRGPESAP